MRHRYAPSSPSVIMTTPKLSSWKMNIIVQPVTSMRPVSLDTSASMAQMTEPTTDRKAQPCHNRNGQGGKN